MIVTIVKIYLALSLVLWALWGHFQGGSLCLTSSVCWSRQCLISILTQGGRWWTLFLGSLVQLRCGEGGMLQTTLACVRVLTVSRPHWVGSHSWHVCFPHLHCLGSRLLCWELSEASPGLYALPRSKPLRFRYSSTP